MELMLAHYDPYPLGEEDQDCREIELTLEAVALRSEIGANEIAVRILGTRHKSLRDPVWTFEGIFYHYGQDSRMPVEGRFNVKTRKGRIRIGPHQE